MKKITLLMIPLFLLVFCLFGQSVRTKITINEGWKFKKGEVPLAERTAFDDKSWENISVPHTWNDKDVMDDEDGYYMGIGWYRKNLNIPSSFKDKKIFLFFEGANQVADVFINGTFVGRHIGGYTAFRFEITDKVQIGKPNTLAVKVDNSYSENIPPISADFTFYGGIYRDIFIEAVEPIHFDMKNFASQGVFVRTEVGEKTSSVSVKGDFINETNAPAKSVLKITLRDANNTVVAEKTEKAVVLKAGQKQNFATQLTLSSLPQLWSPDSPYLYTVEIKLVSEKLDVVYDAITVNTAFRTFTYNATDGAKLNGKPIKLIGANRHQDYALIGNALSDELHLQDMKLLKDMGANFIRIAHYPQDPAILEACDKLGLLVWEEVPLVNEIRNTEVFFENSKTMLTEMIRQHHNHPSVVMWGYMNEILLAKYRHSKEVYEELKKATTTLANLLDSIVHAEDKYRSSVIAHHGDFEAYDQAKLNDVADITGWNLYFGWYSEGFENFGKFLDKYHEKYPNIPVIVSEYGAGTDGRIHSNKPKRFDHTPEWQLRYHQEYLKTILEKNYVIGSAIWNFVDFNSEGRKDTNPHVNNKGILHQDRTPKDIYYWYQAMLTQKPVLKIASTEWAVRAGTPNEGEDFITQPITVFSNLDEVEMMLDGVSLGKKKVDASRQVIYDVKLKNGINELSIKGEKDGKIAAKDLLRIEAQILPRDLSDKSFDNIAINLGAHFDYVEQNSRLVWLPEKEYSKGSYGYVGGKPLLIWNGVRVGSEKEIFGTDREPIYQTQRDSLQAFRFDVANGQYEVELLFCELFSAKEKKKLIYNLGNDAKEDGLVLDREFDVLINGKLVIENLNLSQWYGEERGISYKVEVEAENNKGVEVKFVPKKGNPILNAIRLRKMY